MVDRLLGRQGFCCRPGDISVTLEGLEGRAVARVCCCSLHSGMLRPAQEPLCVAVLMWGKGAIAAGGVVTPHAADYDFAARSVVGGVVAGVLPIFNCMCVCSCWRCGDTRCLQFTAGQLCLAFPPLHGQLHDSVAGVISWCVIVAHDTHTPPHTSHTVASRTCCPVSQLRGACKVVYAVYLFCEHGRCLAECACGRFQLKRFWCRSQPQAGGCKQRQQPSHAFC